MAQYPGTFLTSLLLVSITVASLVISNWHNHFFKREGGVGDTKESLVHSDSEISLGKCWSSLVRSQGWDNNSLWLLSASSFLFHGRWQASAT